MATAPQLRYVADEQPAEYDIIDALPAGEDRHPEYDDASNQDEETPAVPIVRVVTPATTFAFEVGHQVLPAPTAPAYTIIWRGQFKERRPDTGWVHRVNVYRLDDGFWDCYREDELHAA
jgi:hypothetical protein